MNIKENKKRKNLFICLTILLVTIFLAGAFLLQFTNKKEDSVVANAAGFELPSDTIKGIEDTVKADWENSRIPGSPSSPQTPSFISGKNYFALGGRRTRYYLDRDYTVDIMIILLTILQQ